LRIQSSLSASVVRFEEALWIPIAASQSNDAKECWVFGNGTVVCWGLEEEDARRFAESITDGAKNSQISPLKVVETEELEFVVDPAE
jgi:uncharacterized Rmd1/YagE family protein